MQVDGFVANTTHVLVNEAKTHLHEDDIKKLVETTSLKLKVALANPLLYRSDPAGIAKQLAGLTPVKVVSCKGYTAEAKALCTTEKIHMLESDGSGFQCTL